jgi:hypothetical protein
MLTKTFDVMKKLLIVLIVVGMGMLASCTPKLTLTEKTGLCRSKTIDYGTDLSIKNDTLRFRSKKGTMRVIDLNQYDVVVKNNGKTH